MLRTRKTKVVSACPRGGCRGSGAITRNRVVLVVWSSMCRASTSSPWISPASSEASAARLGSFASATPGRRAGGVGADARGDAVLAQEAAALAEQRRLAEGGRHLVEPGPGNRQEVGMHPHEVLADDVQPRVRQRVVDVGDPAVGRVLDRQHGEVGGALLDGGDRRLEAVARQRVELRKRLAAGLVRIGARGALERNLAGRRAHSLIPDVERAELMAESSVE